MGADLYTKLRYADSEVFSIIEGEMRRQRDHLQLIASENMVSMPVLEAQGSIMTNKYAEGYPAARYYSGCEFHDKIESLAVDRLCQLFGCKFANVQPHSGSQANQAVFYALLSPGDTILGLSLDCGGHLTHGARPNLSGRWFNSVQYGLDPDTHIIDMDQVEEMAVKHKPKLIICGSSAYPRYIDFARFRKIADKVGAYLLADIAHYSGLVATGNYPSPINYADVITSTTHKTLRGPRGGVVMTNDPNICKKVNSALFPGIQGGPLMHAIAAKAVAFGECLKPEFSSYCKAMVDNARALVDNLKKYSYKIVTDGTDSHIILLDLRNKNLKGNVAVTALERSGIICNKNAVPFDPEGPKVTSGLRLGTPFETSRGLSREDFLAVGELIHKVLSTCCSDDESIPALSSTTENAVKEDVLHLCQRFPFYQLES